MFFRKPKFNNNDDGKKTEQIMSQREDLKNQIADNLKKIGFTTMEVTEVLNVIEEVYSNIEKAKLKLIGSNINNQDPNIIMKAVFDEIHQYQKELPVKIKEKIQEIKLRKETIK